MFSHNSAAPVLMPYTGTSSGLFRIEPELDGSAVTKTLREMGGCAILLAAHFRGVDDRRSSKDRKLPMTRRKRLCRVAQVKRGSYCTELMVTQVAWRLNSRQQKKARCR
jgi:hypothetical protein